MNALTHTYLDAQAAALDDARAIVRNPQGWSHTDILDACSDMRAYGDWMDWVLADTMEFAIMAERRNKPPATFLGCDAAQWHDALADGIGFIAVALFVFVIFGLASRQQLPAHPLV